MLLGAAHSAGKYTVPNGSGDQFLDGSTRIYDGALQVLKVYCTGSYLTDYPLQTVWSSTPTSCVELLQTDQFTTAFSQFDTFILTMFSFANGPTNWWHVDPTNARMAAEYNEVRAAVEHLRTTYAGQGKTFIIQNWEGDWAFMDSFAPDTYVNPHVVERYAAFLGTRQRAVRDGCAAAATDTRVLYAFEANRVLDARLFPHRRRILRDIAKRVQPDMISWSAYDGTIVQQGGWGADLAAWEAATVPVMRKCLRAIKAAFPGIPVYIGEFGFPEGVELPPGRDVGAMIQVVYDVALEEGVEVLIYWQVFDNEETSPGVPRGFYTVKPDGSVSVAGAKMTELA